MSDRLLDYIEVATGPNPHYSIIWLHGLGADGNDFVPFVSALHLPVACRFIFPHALRRPISCNQGYIMRAWYDIVDFNQLDHAADLTGIHASREALHALIKQENSRGIPTDRIFLAGFSQGGAMVYMTGLSYPERLAGLIALSTYIPDKNWLSKAYYPANQVIPLFIGHGNVDNIVPEQLGRAAYEFVCQLGNPATYHCYPTSHAVCPAEVEDILGWLIKIIQLP